MNTIIAFIILVLIASWLTIFGPFQGSESTDFSEHAPTDGNPLPPCPNSPNCIRISISFQTGASILLNTISAILEEMGAERLTEDPERLYIHSIFQIPFFGFKDDMDISITEDHEFSTVHLRSASRIGYSDLGVNRRRVGTFLDSLKERIKTEN